MNNKLINFLVFCLFLGLSLTDSHAREVISINKNWQFTAELATPRGLGWGTGPSRANRVNLPHTWNDIDFMSDGGYRRGYGSYSKDLEIPADYKGKRLFLRFEGAGSIANVFVNSNHLGDTRELIPLSRMK